MRSKLKNTSRLKNDTIKHSSSFYTYLHDMSKEMEILKGWQSVGMIKINGAD